MKLIFESWKACRMSLKGWDYLWHDPRSYILGHADTLRADGSLPESESDEDVNRIFSMLASQPVSQNLRGPSSPQSRKPADSYHNHSRYGR